MSDKISEVSALRVWDSRGNPTVEVTVTTDSGAVGRAIAPAGASRGSREALDLRDGGDRLGGKDVRGAVAGVSDRIAPVLHGFEVADQRGIDTALIDLDGTELKSELGGNATVATSLAVMHAAAASAGVPLWQHIAQVHGRAPSIPLPEIQIFGGGAHAAQRIDIQDFMIMVPGASSFDEVMDVTSEVYRAAGSLISKKHGPQGVADEGGWWPAFDSNEEGLELLTRAIELTGEKPGDRVVISLDIAASEFGKNGRYRLGLEDRDMDSGEMIDLLGRWIDSYPIVSIEDPLGEDDAEGQIAFTRAYGDRIQIIGDDYLVTNADLVRKAAAEGSCNAVLVKVNQAGTVSEAMDTVAAAEKAGYRCVVSARSGETEDVSITHLAAGLGTGQLKVGSITRTERTIKWNECLRLASADGMGPFVGGLPLAETWWGQKGKDK